MRHGKVYRVMAGGPRQRINLLRHLITALVKFERLEAPYSKAHETQKYAERLINIAKRGDTDEEAMKIADYWLTDKRQVHKLFKVLAPRFQNKPQEYTQLFRVPGYRGVNNVQTAFLEFLGNPYPPLRQAKKQNPEWIVNILIREAVNKLKNSRALDVLGSDKTENVESGKCQPEGVEQLGVALDGLQLGVSQEGAVAAGHDDSQKEGTPV